jgi:hypothetical protein
MTQIVRNNRKAASNFTEREIERLRWYRSAVRAGFYTDQCRSCATPSWVAPLVADCIASAQPHTTPKTLAPASSSRARADERASVV